MILFARAKSDKSCLFIHVTLCQKKKSLLDRAPEVFGLGRRTTLIYCILSHSKSGEIVVLVVVTVFRCSSRNTFEIADVQERQSRRLVGELRRTSFSTTSVPSSLFFPSRVEKREKLFREKLGAAEKKCTRPIERNQSGRELYCCSGVLALSNLTN